MSPARLGILTVIAMIAFAGNSILCRLALSETGIDAASFTSIRVLSGAVVLALLLLGGRSSLRGRSLLSGGNWVSATSLFIYAAGFSYAYISLTAATGALLLFGAVQATMISVGLYGGERPNPRQLMGMGMALIGLLILFLPGFAPPPFAGALLMTVAGMAWGVYSLRGRGAGDATQETAGNFLRAVPLALLISLLTLTNMNFDFSGVLYAVASGALASGAGYAVWYTVLPYLKATSAATVQLSVPVIAALGGVLFLNESVTLGLVLASVAILGGVGLYIFSKEDTQ